MGDNQQQWNAQAHAAYAAYYAAQYYAYQKQQQQQQQQQMQQHPQHYQTNLNAYHQHYLQQQQQVHATSHLATGPYAYPSAYVQQPRVAADPSLPPWKQATYSTVRKQPNHVASSTLDYINMLPPKSLPEEPKDSHTVILTEPSPPPPPMPSSSSSDTTIASSGEISSEPDSWPESLKRLVEASFATCKSAEQKDWMEIKLKRIIQNAANQGMVKTIDWSRYPIPLLDSEEFMEWSKKRQRDEELLKRTTASIAHPVSQPQQQKVSRKHQALVAKKDERSKRFLKDSHILETNISKRQMDPSPSACLGNSEVAISIEPIVGTSDALEKPYLRLTSAPDPSTVRSFEACKRSLKHLKDKYKNHKTNLDYGWITDQFKSLRQDLTVQHIRNAFTVNVYEIQARIALENTDLNQYNQCQTQLKDLYEELGDAAGGSPFEFLAYRILYMIKTGNRRDINALLADLTNEQRNAPAVKHALDVRSAVSFGNYYRLFQLYKNAPNLGGYIMDTWIQRERLYACKVMFKGIRPALPLNYVTDILVFDNEFESKEVNHQWLHCNIIESSPGIIDTKNSLLKILQSEADKIENLEIK